MNLEEMSREDLLALVRWHERRLRASRKPTTLELWKALDALRPLAGAVPHLQTVLDYLDDPLEVVDGERGYWFVCVLCKQEKFATAATDSLLCVTCASRAARMHCHLGWDARAAFLSHTPAELNVFVERGPAAAALAEYLENLARYARNAAEDK